MAGLLKHWREAATLILVTSSKLTPKRAHLKLTSAASPAVVRHQLQLPDPAEVNDFDVLLIQRSSKSKFMPNLHVFPGGVADNSDFSPQWLSFFERKLGPEVQQKLFQHLAEGNNQAASMFNRQRDPSFSAIPSEVAFRLCAIRETFEESGVLLALPAEISKRNVNSLFIRNQSKNNEPITSVLCEDPNIIKAWRKKVNEDPNKFIEMCQELDLVPEVWSLYEWSNWLTPARSEENQRRFDTVFFIACIDHKPEAVEDSAETVNVVWASPSSLLTAYYKQHGGLGPPQVYELARLAYFRSGADILKWVTRPGRARVQRLLPGAVSTTDHLVEIFPGDDLYPPKEVDPYDKNILLNFDGSLEELNQKYPKHNRFVFESRIVSNIFCNVPVESGNIPPNISLFNKIKARVASKL